MLVFHHARPKVAKEERCCVRTHVPGRLEAEPWARKIVRTYLLLY